MFAFLNGAARGVEAMPSSLSVASLDPSLLRSATESLLDFKLGAVFLHGSGGAASNLENTSHHRRFKELSKCDASPGRQRAGHREANGRTSERGMKQASSADRESCLCGVTDHETKRRTRGSSTTRCFLNFSCLLPPSLPLVLFALRSLN